MNEVQHIEQAYKQARGLPGICEPVPDGLTACAQLHRQLGIGKAQAGSGGCDSLAGGTGRGQIGRLGRFFGHANPLGTLTSSPSLLATKARMAAMIGVGP